MSGPDSTPTAVESRDLDSVEVPARYDVGGEIGRGGMGTVVEATDTVLDRPVALKLLRALDARHIARLLGEAKAMARLSHPNVVHVYDVVTSGDGALIVMELVRGRTLRQWLSSSSPDATQILEKFVQAGEGLQAAHRAGLVHLDFKPSNVLIGDDGVAKVTDFGLARSTDFEGRGPEDLGPDVRSSAGLEGGVASWGLLMTQHGLIAGTPRYMSPEQHKGARCGPATDIYAFCVSIWEALAGRPPFTERGGEELLAAKLKGPPVWDGPPLPSTVVATLRRGLSAEAADRPDTLDEILDALRHSEREAGRWRKPVLAVGAALAIGVGSWALATNTGSTASPPLEGYGTGSSFGRDGLECKVTTLDDKGPGSLRDCLATHAGGESPMEISFRVGGTIELGSILRIDRPHLTIDGLSAPAPGITLAGEHSRGVVLTDDADAQTCAHDVLIQGVRFLGSWDGTQHDPGEAATVEMIARDVPDCMRNIVLNRVTIVASQDAAGDMVGSVQDVTVQYSAFLRSHHPMELTNRPGEPLLHARVSLHHNVFAYFHERSPQIRGMVEDVDLVQNVFMNWNAYDFGGGYAVRVRCREGRCPKRLNLVGNHWASGSGDPTHSLVFGRDPEQDEDDGPIAPEIFMRDNVIPAANANFGLAPKEFASGAQITEFSTSSYLTDVLPWVGAPHRTDIEASILDEVAARMKTDQQRL